MWKKKSLQADTIHRVYYNYLLLFYQLRNKILIINKIYKFRINNKKY